MTKDQHDKMVHSFVEHLDPSTSYTTELEISLDEKNVGFVDVVIWASGHAFLFEMKSESKDFSGDVQQLRRYAYALRQTQSHSWRKLHLFLVYPESLRERVLAVRNLFGGVQVMLMGETTEPLDLDGRNLTTVIGSGRERFWKLRTIFRILRAGAS